MSTPYLRARNKPGRMQTPTFNLTLVIDKSLGSSDKIRLPENVINEIMRLYPNNPPSPMIFEMVSTLKSSLLPQLHCGVLEFTAPRNTALIPYWMTHCLTDSKGARISEGQRMKFLLVRALEAATFAKFRPLDKRFSRDIQTPRATLEHALRKFTVLTVGQRIPIIHDGKVYPLQVLEVTPSPASHLIDTNLRVEFTAFDASKSSLESDHEFTQQNMQEYSYNVSQELALYTKVTSTAKNKLAVYYRVRVGNPNFPIRSVLTVVSGDCNIYISQSHDLPNIARHDWLNESDKRNKVVCISNDDPMFANWFYFGIHSYGNDDDACEFTFFVDQEMGDDDGSSENEQKTEAHQMKSEKKKESDLLCENCGKWISSQAYSMHSMRCANVNWKCSICEIVIAKAMKSSHIHCTFKSAKNDVKCSKVFLTQNAMERHCNLRHSKINCELCTELHFPNEMAVHLSDACVARKVSCEWCGMKLKFEDCDDHQKYCGATTIECELCGESVTRKWLQNHLASEHNINPTLQTTLVNNIIHSNLGLDQSIDWERKESKEQAIVKGLDDEDANCDDGMTGKDDIEDLDPVVESIKRQLSRVTSVNDVSAIERNKTAMITGNDYNEFDEDHDDDDDDDEEDVHEFLCPFCQTYPPKSIDFGEHLANCNEQTMDQE